MNADLYRQLFMLGVFHGPAAELAVMYDDPAETAIVIRAFKRHVIETGSIALAVWRLKNGALLTGAELATVLHNEERNREWIHVSNIQLTPQEAPQ